MKQQQFNEIIFENILSGNIDKEAGVKILEQIKNVKSDDVAIIGISLRLPGAKNIGEFWENLINGVDGIRSFPDSRRKEMERYLSYVGQSDKLYSIGAYLDEIDKFDSGFFRISPKEASFMNPNQRLFLETAWETIEDAGYGGSKLHGSKTGVYLGYSADEIYDYKKIIFDTDPSAMSEAMVGNLSSIIPSRISYLLNLKGPSMLVDTACSSSLVAVHQACQAIRLGECDMAIAGGVRLHLLRLEGQLNVGMKSSDGRTKSFDDRSDGTGSGEGAGAVLLKPLDQALKDRDHIYAVIKGSAINQDGTSVGITAPNVLSQEEVISLALKKAKINPETVSYVETHGSGTKLGDPIEIDGIRRAFQRWTNRKQFCAIGSVKTNLGHLDHASGIVGLIKTVLTVKNGKIPPLLHFKKPNRNIDFENSPVFVNEELTDWPVADHPRRGGINSFGISGTNCHLLIEEAPIKTEKREEFEGSGKRHIFTLSAASMNSLSMLIDKYRTFDFGDSTLQDVCYTASTGRGHYEYRISIITDSVEDLREKLKSIDLQHCNQDMDICYGEHKVVSEHKANRLKTEITSNFLNDLSNNAATLIENLIHNDLSHTQNLTELSRYYCQGATIDWELFYLNSMAQKVSLPPYAFDKSRCWVEIPLVEEASHVLYETVWKPEKSKPDLNRADLGNVLVITNDHTGSSIVDTMRKMGQTVVEASFTGKFGKLTEQKYTIGFDWTDLEKLLKDMYIPSRLTVIYATGMRDNGADLVSELSNKLNTGLYGLFALIQAWNQVCPDTEMDLAILAKHAGKVTGTERSLSPENNMMFGLGKVLAMENEQLLCRCLDVDEEMLQMPERIIEELYTRNSPYKVAFRDGQRWIEMVRPINTLDFSLDKGILLKDEGVYVITGGTGGIGIEISSALASKKKINLVFINRSLFPSRNQWDSILQNSMSQDSVRKKIKAIREMEDNGSTVRFYQADVSQETEVRKAFDDIRAEFGHIDGIIHGAGTGGGTLAILENVENIDKVLSPKVRGTLLLDELTKEDGLDFFIVFSSAITLTGGLGGGSYTAANAFLDAFAEKRSLQGQRTLSIRWPVWSNTGLSEGVAEYEEKQLFKTIMPDQALAAFEHACSMKQESIIIGEVNFQTTAEFTDLVFDESTQAKFSGRSGKKTRPILMKDNLKGKISLTGNQNNEYTEFEKSIGQIWCKVLGFSTLNIYDNFYELGGDSMGAMRIIQTIHKELNVAVEISDFFSNLTVMELAKCLERLAMSQSETKHNAYPTLEKVELKAYYPLSSAQKKLYVLNQLDKAEVNYNEPAVMRVVGSLDEKKLLSVVRQIILRHDMLRTSFVMEDGIPVQKVADKVDFEFHHVSTDTTNLQSAIRDCIRPFELTKAPLMRIVIILESEGSTYIVFDMHHIISDAISLHIFMEEIMKLYCGEQIVELPIQYADFTVWQKKLLTSETVRNQEEYWLGVFSDNIPVLRMPTDFERTEKKNYEGKRVSLNIGQLTYSRMKAVTKELGMTSFMFLLAAYSVALSKFSYQEDLVIGIPTAGRPDSKLDQVIGIFINTLAIRTMPEGNKTSRAFLNEVKHSAIRAFENQDYPFEELVDRLGIERDANRNPIFETMFSMHNYSIADINFGEMSLLPIPLDAHSTKFEVELSAVEEERDVILTMRYASALFKQDTMVHFLQGIVRIIHLIVVDLDRPLSDLVLDDEEEHARSMEKIAKLNQAILSDF